MNERSRNRALVRFVLLPLLLLTVALLGGLRVVFCNSIFCSPLVSVKCDCRMPAVQPSPVRDLLPPLSTAILSCPLLVER